MTVKDVDFESVNGDHKPNVRLTVDEDCRISGLTFTWSLFDANGNAVVTYTSRMLTKDTSNGNITAISATEVQLVIDSGDTQDLDAGSYKHELEVTDGINITTLCKGRVSIIKGIID